MLAVTIGLTHKPEIGASQADFAVITSSWLNKVAGVGSAHDAKTYYNKYGRNQMTITQKQKLQLIKVDYMHYLLVVMIQEVMQT